MRFVSVSRTSSRNFCSAPFRSRCRGRQQLGTPVPCSSVSQVQQDQEIALSNQSKILLLKFLVQDIEGLVQTVLAAITSLELSSRKPVHHHRQSVVRSQPVQDLVPFHPDRMIQFRSGISGFQFRLRIGFFVLKGPRGFRKSHGSDGGGQTSTHQDIEPTTRVSTCTGHCVILDSELSAFPIHTNERTSYSRVVTPH